MGIFNVLELSEATGSFELQKTLPCIFIKKTITSEMTFGKWIYQTGRPLSTLRLTTFSTPKGPTLVRVIISNWSSSAHHLWATLVHQKGMWIIYLCRAVYFWIFNMTYVCDFHHSPVRTLYTFPTIYSFTFLFKWIFTFIYVVACTLFCFVILFIVRRPLFFCVQD